MMNRFILSITMVSLSHTTILVSNVVGVNQGMIAIVWLRECFNCFLILPLFNPKLLGTCLSYHFLAMEVMYPIGLLRITKRPIGEHGPSQRVPSTNLPNLNMTLRATFTIPNWLVQISHEVSLPKPQG